MGWALTLLIVEHYASCTSAVGLTRLRGHAPEGAMEGATEDCCESEGPTEDFEDDDDPPMPIVIPPECAKMGPSVMPMSLTQVSSMHEKQVPLAPAPAPAVLVAAPVAAPIAPPPAAPAAPPPPGP